MGVGGCGFGVGVSVPPPPVEAVTGRSPPKKPRKGAIEDLSDIDMRQRVRDAILRFQAAPESPGPNDAQQIKLVRQWSR